MAAVKCIVTQPAFINGALLQPDQKIMLDEKYLVADKNGKKILTPHWCIRLEPQEVEDIVTVSPDTKVDSPPKKENKKDIFAGV